MTDPRSEIELTEPALRTVFDAAAPYLDRLAQERVQRGEPDLGEFAGELPEHGVGTIPSVQELTRVATAAATHSTGPRFFHFVTGGATPAAQAGDWLTGLLDQVAGLWTASPLATEAETLVLRWLTDLFGLPGEFGGVLTPSATFANLTGLACARQWWAQRHGVDVVADGLAGLPRMPVFSSGYLHASSRKALQILGCGRDSARLMVRDDAGRLDVAALDRALTELAAPAVLIGNAGEVNAGDFDPLDELVELAERHGAWLHVDGAFGLFAAVSPRTALLTRGVERADSIAADGHKWLNVPYESGFAFVRDPGMLARAFGSWHAAYLANTDDERIDYNNLGPESSRRARAFPILATLRAYGRQGYRAMVERHLDLASRLVALVQHDPDFELLAPVQLNVVCFRYRPAGAADAELDRLNQRLGAAILADGTVYLGTTQYRGMTALRPAIVNWRTTDRDIDQLFTVVRTLARGLD